MDQPAQERARGQDNSGRPQFAAILTDDTAYPALINDKIADAAFDDIEVFLLRQCRLHGKPVEFAVGLRPGSAYGRSLAAVEQPELDTRLIGNTAHDAVHRVDLAHQMTLAKPANGRIAGHHADRIRAMGHQRRRGTHARSRSRSLAAGMAAANHDDIIILPHGGVPQVSSVLPGIRFLHGLVGIDPAATLGWNLFHVNPVPSLPAVIKPFYPAVKPQADCALTKARSANCFT